MNPPESDRFKHDYHKYADQQVNDRAHGDAMGRLRLSAFVAAIGPGACILMHTIKYEPSSLIRNGVILTIPVALILLVVNFIRLPAKAKGSPVAVSILLITLLASAATYPLVRAFFPVAR